jgi:hypothetical protein
MAHAYKKALHGFFMKVHPDFFARNLEWQRANETNIATLNELLNWAKDFKGGANRPPPSTAIDFTFHRRPDEDAASSPVIQTRFELPKGFVAGPTTVGMAERAVNKFLRDLLRRADCIDEATAGLSATQDTEQNRQEMRRTMNQRRSIKPVRTLMDEAADTAAEVAMPVGAPSIDDLIQSDQILFSRELSPQQCAIAVQTLSAGLPQMLYERWYLVPVIVGNAWGIESSGVQGCITIPWSFSAPQFHSFITENTERLQTMKQRVSSLASMIEGLIADIGRSLDVDDVLITCPHRDALQCLHLLRDHAQLIGLHGVAGITLEVGDHFGYRDNGVLIFDRNMTLDRLQKKLPAIGERMPELKRNYARAKSLLQSIEFHLKDVVESLRPQMIDVTTCDLPYEKRVQFVQELHRVTPRLAQYDWSDFTFFLSPEDVSIDWDSGIIMLPAHFDGEALVRYVTDVNRDAQEKDKEALKEFEAARRETNEAVALAATPDLTDEASNGQSEDIMRALDGKKHPLQPVRPEDAWRSEYLTSSDRGGEEFSVEPPLAHSREFANAEDADDQMRWEGTFAEPGSMAMHRGADAADLENMWLATNKKHREAAVKKITEELTAKYKYARQGFKIGDRVGINDPKVQPRVFPTVMKGTYVPPKPTHGGH